MRPSVGFASLRLLEAADCEVIVPEGQTCCGQPAWSTGDRPPAADLARKQQVSIIDHVGMGVRSALQRLRQHQREFGYVISPDQAFMGVVSIDTLQTEMQANPDPKLRHAFIPGVQPITADTPIGELYGPVAAHPHGVPVVDPEGRYRGSINKNTLLEFLDQRSAA
mgnify:CR=1 FL=1